jgi:outer membrane murein-binding lipoprotein Lpp
MKDTTKRPGPRIGGLISSWNNKPLPESAALAARRDGHQENRIARPFPAGNPVSGPSKNGLSMKKTLSLMVPVLLLSLGGCVSPQRIVQMDHRLSSLERQVQEIRGETAAMRSRVDTALGSSDQSLRSRAAGLAADISRLDEEVQLLRGRIEEAGYAERKKAESVESLRANVGVELGQLRDQLVVQQEKITVLEQYLNLESGAAQLGENAGPQAAGKPLTEDEAYQCGQKGFRRAAITRGPEKVSRNF